MTTPQRLFLPIEIKVREFHGKMLFALHAAEQGFETVLGGQIELMDQLPRLGRGLYIDKSVSILKGEWFRKCLALGNWVSAWDEEGLLYMNDDVYHTTRMQEEAFRQMDLFFAWGPSQVRTVLSRYPEAKDLVVAVGNPRMDLLRPEIRGYCDASVAELRRKHGRTILINTNFPLHNFAKGRAATAHIFDPYPLKNKEALLQAWYPFQEQGYEGFMKAAAALHDRFPSHTIVVRPAPAEDIRPWQKLFEGKPRGMVSKDGNVVEWIRAADAIVQFNCTTAIEAFLLDVPSVAYRCVQSEIFDCPLAIACSSEAFTLDELFTQVQAAVSAADAGRPPERHWSKNRALIEDHLTSLEGPTACERIVAELRRRDFPPHPYTLPPVPLIKRIWRAWLRVVRRPDPSDLRFYREKFPGLELAEARAVAADFARITGRFAKVRITRAGPHLVRIAPA